MKKVINEIEQEKIKAAPSLVERFTFLMAELVQKETVIIKLNEKIDKLEQRIKVLEGEKVNSKSVEKRLAIQKE